MLTFHMNGPPDPEPTLTSAPCRMTVTWKLPLMLNREGKLHSWPGPPGVQMDPIFQAKQLTTEKIVKNFFGSILWCWVLQQVLDTSLEIQCRCAAQFQRGYFHRTVYLLLLLYMYIFFLFLMCKCGENWTDKKHFICVHK